MPEFIVPSHCWGAVVRDEGPNFWVSVEKVPVPRIAEHEVLIKINATGVCYSDIHFMMNDTGQPKMSEFGTRCAGHEGAGVIVKVGGAVSKLKVGMRAGFKPIVDTCQECLYCLTGKDSYCLKATFTGMHVNGSFQQYVKSPERYTTLIPDDVPDIVAGPIMCSGATMYSAIQEARLEPGSWAVFLGGGGGLGLQGVQIASALGIRPIVIDTGDERRQISLDLGAELFLDFRTQETVKKVLEVTEEGAHAVFVTAAPSYPDALKYLGLRAGGQVMCVGLPPSGEYHIDLDPTSLIVRNQSVKGTLVSSLKEVDATLALASAGKLSLKPVVVGLDQFNEIVQKLKSGEIVGRAVIDLNADFKKRDNQPRSDE